MLRFPGCPGHPGTAAIWRCRGIFAAGDSGRFMAEAADDLSTPLGQETVRAKRRLRLPFTATQALAVLLGLFLAGFFGFALFNDDPLGGEPRAKIVLRQPSGEAEKAAGVYPAAETKASPRQVAGPAGQQTGTIIEGSSGKRQDFVVGGDASPKDGEQAPVPMAGIDQRLLEKSRYGMVPMMADGLKPFTVYAAEADRAKAAKMPV